MSEELSDFLQLVAEEKAKVKAKPKKVARAKPDMSELFKQLAELKEQETKKAEVTQEQLLQFEQIFSPKNVEAIIEEVAEEVEVEELAEEVIEPVVEEVKEQTLVERSLGLLTSPSDEKNSDPLTPLNQEFVTQKDFQKHYTKIIERIQQQLSTVGGGGEVNLRYLDDVDRSTISDGRWLKYNGTTRKFEFDEINPFEVVHNTTLVDEATYIVNDTDYYIGVNYAGEVTITLPSSPNSGRLLVIKDESGNAETNPITVTGTVDNDAGGFVLGLDNGSITLIYRSGWRIV